MTAKYQKRGKFCGSVGCSGAKKFPASGGFADLTPTRGSTPGSAGSPSTDPVIGSHFALTMCLSCAVQNFPQKNAWNCDSNFGPIFIKFRNRYLLTFWRTKLDRSINGRGSRDQTFLHPLNNRAFKYYTELTAEKFYKIYSAAVT